jgi:hypothetical protein
MLSVIIPTYNYPTYKLAKEIHKQCEELNIVFEIIVSEDGGNQFLDANRKINNLDHASYIENKINVGRARNKNLLLNLSRYNLKLLLDSDVTPNSGGFIKNYLDFSKKHSSFACFGGLTYEYKNALKHSLRYNYGIKRESKDAKVRTQNPYTLFLTSNTLLKNCNQKFEDKITQYGFEEIVFAESLKTKKIPVFHINNSVIHENLETNKDFINKARQGLTTLIFLEKNNIISKGKIKLSKLYHKLSKLYLSKVLNGLFLISKNVILKQLINKGGPLWLFDFYRLLYFNKNY